jgi:hypothetical protein
MENILLRIEKNNQRVKESLKLNGGIPRKKPIKIKGDPLSIGKKESEIEKEVLLVAAICGILYYEIEIGGQIQSIGNGQAVMKNSKIAGFPDLLIFIKGKTIGIEMKAHDGIWKSEQQNRADEFQSQNIPYRLCTSVSEFHDIMLRVAGDLMASSKKHLLAECAVHFMAWHRGDGTYSQSLLQNKHILALEELYDKHQRNIRSRSREKIRKSVSTEKKINRRKTPQ